MKPLLVTDKAERDLDDYWFYIARDKLDAADRFLRAVKQTMDLIQKHPEIGWQKPFENPRLLGIRLFPVRGFRNYLVFYRETEPALEVIRILHGTQDIENLPEF